MSESNVNRVYRLSARPTARVGREHFKREDELLSPLKDGEVRVKTLYLSLDPTHRIWMTDRPQYMPPVALGEIMRGLGVGVVTESKSGVLKEGDHVMGLLGWQTLGTLKGEGLMKVPELGLPVTDWLGPLGMTACTAYFGLMDIGQPKPGETVVVSAAAGAVGSVACQIAKLMGCYVVGVTGGAEKCAIVRGQFGAGATVDYKRGNLSEQLRQAAPKGIDVYFENVGGELFEAVLQQLNLYARIVFCGRISGYNLAEPAPGPKNFDQILMKRAKLQGFIIMDYQARMQEAVAALAQWRKEGKLRTLETIVDGFDHMVDALNMLFDGGNTGKLMVRI